MEQTAFHVPRDESRDQWEEAIEIIVQHVGGGVLRVPRQVPRLPASPDHAEAVPGPAPAVLDGGDVARAARPSPGELGLGLLSFSIMQPLDKMAAADRASTARRRRTPTPITRVTTNKVAAYTLVHCAETMAQGEANGIWDSVWWWYKNLAEFTLEWEFPNFPESERDADLPAAEAPDRGQLRGAGVQRRRHDHRRRPRALPREDEALRRPRRRPADLLRAVRPPRARVDHARRSSCSARRSSPSSSGDDVADRRHVGRRRVA